MVSQSVKNLYNTYLAVTRSCQNKPFKLRQDFSDFYETESFVLIKKVQRFLNQHPEIDPEMFFKAPYAIHPGEIFDLKFYTSLAAVKKYVSYINQMYNLPFDNAFHLNLIRDSLKFLKKFCSERKIEISSYIKYSENGVFPVWFTHLKNRQISPLMLYGFTHTKDIIDSTEPDIVDLLISQFNKDYYSNLSKYKNSKKARVLVERGLELLIKS